MKDNDLGNVLLEARQKAKISQLELAKKLHISRQSISNWENNYNVPDLNMLKNLCKILNLNFEKVRKMTCYYNKFNRKEMSKVVIFFIIAILLLITVIILLITFRTRLSVYNIFIEDNNTVALRNGVFVESNANYYFSLGTLELFDDNINEYMIRIYYKTEDGVKLLIESNYTENITIDESNGYEEYFCDLFDTDKVYIDLISLKDLNVTSTFKLEFKKVLKNNKLFNIKSRRIFNNQQTEEINYKSSFSIENLLKKGYTQEYNKYNKKIENGNFQYDLNTSTLFFFNESTNLKYNFKDEIIVGNEYDFKNKTIIINFTFDDISN